MLKVLQMSLKFHTVIRKTPAKGKNVDMVQLSEAVKSNW